MSCKLLHEGMQAERGGEAFCCELLGCCEKITEKNKGWCWCDLLLVAGKHCGKLNLIGDFDVEGLQ
jgi:hypothetical protein